MSAPIAASKLGNRTRRSRGSPLPLGPRLAALGDDVADAGVADAVADADLADADVDAGAVETDAAAD
jgi:hypothetical protein